MSMIFRAIAFTFVPTVVELALVSVVMARTFSPLVSALVVLTFAAYVLFSIGMTQVRHGCQTWVSVRGPQCPPATCQHLHCLSAYNLRNPSQAATQSRKVLNVLDTMVSGRAVDTLINYETVKLFNNQQLEVARYDEYLVGYQR